MAGNLTETLLHLIDTIQENTRALTHLQQQQQQGQQGREEGKEEEDRKTMLSGGRIEKAGRKGGGKESKAV